MSNGSYVVEAPAVPLVNHGDSAKRFDIVLLAEGYTEDQQNLWVENADELAMGMLDYRPFSAIDCELGMNIWRVDVVSEQTGMEDPNSCEGGTGYKPNTYFGAYRCAGEVQRAIDFPSHLPPHDVASDQVPNYDVIFVVINSPLDAGSSINNMSAFTTAPQPVGSWIDVALHELGHSGFQLADEYEYWKGCDATGQFSDGSDHNQYPWADEPAEPNVTINGDLATIKWAKWVTPTATPVLNLDCTKCTPNTSPLPLSTVGAFEGAKNYHCGIFRPVFGCRMYSNSSQFCPVCTDWITKNLLFYTAYQTWPGDNDPTKQVDPWSPELAWTPGQWESAWELQITDQADFTGAAIIPASKTKLLGGQNVAYATDEIGALKPDTTYRWRVRKVTPAGPQPKTWTKERTFKTAPKKVQPVSPRSNNRNEAQYPWQLEFNWLGPDGTDADHYEIQVTDKVVTDQSGQTVPDWSKLIFPTVETDPTDGTSIELTVKVKSTMHWRARAIPAAGASYAGAWSDPVPLITTWPKVTISSPENNDPAYPWPVRLEWSKVEKAAKYMVEIERRKDQWGRKSVQKHLDNLPQDTTHVDLNLRPRPTADHETHQWRVRVWGPPLGPIDPPGTESEEGQNPGLYTFFNDGDKTIPTLIDGAENPGSSGPDGIHWGPPGPKGYGTKLSWHEVTRAEGYRMQLMTFGDGTETPDTVAFDKKFKPDDYAPGPEHWIVVDSGDLDPSPGVGVTGYWWNITAIGPEELGGLGKPPGRQFWIQPDRPILLNPGPNASAVDYEDPIFEFTGMYTPSGKYRVYLQDEKFSFIWPAEIPGSANITNTFRRHDVKPSPLLPDGATYSWGARAHSDLSIDHLYGDVVWLEGTNPALFHTKAEEPPPAPQLIDAKAIWHAMGSPAYPPPPYAFIAFTLVAGADHYRAEAFQVDCNEEQTPIDGTNSWEKAKNDLIYGDTPTVGQTGIPLPSGGVWMLLGPNPATDPTLCYQFRVQAAKGGNWGPFSDLWLFDSS